VRPKLLFFSTLSAAPYWGGSEKYWYDAVLDPRFRAALDCRVMLRESEATRAVADRLRGAGVEVGWCRPADGLLGRIGKRIGRMRRRADRKGYETWYHEIGRLRPDLVWFNLSHIGAVADLRYATALCAREGIPYWLILKHAHDHYFPADEAERARFERVVAGAARVVCVSGHNRRVLELAAGRPLENVLMGTNAVTHDFVERAAAADAASPVRADGTARLLCLARLKFENKGQHRLLEALSGRAWAGRDWRLRLVGGGPHAAQVARLVDYFGIDRDRVEVRGHRDDVIAAVADSDLLVMPSISEAGPYVMVEAMACGRPAVGTPVGRIPELVVEGRTGWLAESTEAAHLAAALERAWCDRGAWPRRGAEARARVAAGYDLDGTLPPIVDALRHDARRAGIAPASALRGEDVGASAGRRDERVEEPALP
jgi:glycosyltransferase involved in cell wall biosynthesis